MSNGVRTDIGNWEPLFNGTDLARLESKIVGHTLGENFGNTFRVENGILSVKYDVNGNDFNDRFGALYFKENFSW